MQNALVEHSAIPLTCIKLPHGFQTFVLSIFEWRLKTGFTVTLCILGNFSCFHCRLLGADSHDTDSTVIDNKATSETDKQITDSGVGEISPSSDTGVKDGLPDVQVVDTTVDSAVSLSYNGVTSHNGDIHIDPKEDTGSKELVDSR